MQNFEVSGLLLATTMGFLQQSHSGPPDHPACELQQSVETGPAMSNSQTDDQGEDSNSGGLYSTSLDSTANLNQGNQSTLAERHVREQ